MRTKKKDEQLALMIHGNTPLTSVKRPAELLFDTSLRTNIPRGKNEVTLEDFRERCTTKAV